MKKVLIILAAVLVAGIGGYFTYRSRYSSPVAVPAGEPGAADGAALATADWLPYHNDEFGFEFRYPRNYSKGDDPQSGQPYFLDLGNSENLFGFIIVADAELDPVTGELDSAFSAEFGLPEVRVINGEPWSFYDIGQKSGCYSSVGQKEIARDVVMFQIINCSDDADNEGPELFRNVLSTFASDGI